MGGDTHRSWPGGGGGVGEVLGWGLVGSFTRGQGLGPRGGSKGFGSGGVGGRGTGPRDGAKFLT